MSTVYKLVDVFQWRNEEVRLFFESVSPGGLCFGDLERASHRFYPVLNTVNSVLNWIDYLHFRLD
jgi:hypothetical protein